MRYLDRLTTNSSWARGRLLLPIIALLVFSKCSSDDQAQAEDPVTQGSGQQGSQNAALNGAPSDDAEESAQQGASMNNSVENNSGGNFGDNGNGFSNSGANDDAAALGASLNNSWPDETMTQIANTALNGVNEGLNGGNPQAVPLNNTAQALNESNSSMAQDTTVTEMSTEGGPAQAEAAPQPTSSDARAAASPFANPQMNWPGKGKVKYVTRQVTRHAAPNGPVIGEFEKGDHPLIYQNGNWVELHDGSFVKGNGLTDQAVGYGKGRKPWR
jgi:hypothetical protein